MAAAPVLQRPELPPDRRARLDLPARVVEGEHRPAGGVGKRGDADLLGAIQLATRDAVATDALAATGKTPSDEKKPLIKWLVFKTETGGGGGSRTRVRKYAVAGIYMRSRT